MYLAGHKENLILCLCTGLLAFIVVPLFMIGANTPDYTFINFSAFFKVAIFFSMVLAFILATVYAALYFLGFRLISSLFVFFSFVWVLLVGLLLPVSVSAGMVDPEEIAVDKVHFVVAFILALGMSIAGLTPARKYLKLFSLVVVVSLIPQTLLAITQSNVGYSSIETSSKSLSRNRNILVIDFDGLPGDVVSELITSNKNYSNKFKDFVLFKNVVSQSPSTKASQLGEVFGVQDFKSKGKNLEEIISAVEKETQTDRLVLRHVANNYQFRYLMGKPMSLRSTEYDILAEMHTFDFFQYPIVRLWTRFSLSYFNWRARTKILKEHLLSKEIVSSVAYRSSNHSVRQFDKLGKLHLSLFKSFVDQLSASTDEPTVRFLHFKFTHYPVDFDENCNYRSDDLEWFQSNQTKDGLRGEAICALNQFSTLLDKLRMLDIYDNSLIVFKSDHGAPANYFNEYPDSLLINGHLYWGYNRYRPALMIKDFANSSPTMVVEDKLALLNDLAKTLCTSSGVGEDCEDISGVNLLGDFNEKDEPYYIYVVKNSKSSYRFDSHISVKIPSRKISLLDAMKESELIVLSEPQSNSIERTVNAH